jgi:hypothetical protein
MQFVDLVLDHPNFFCPVTGQCILNGSDPINDEIPSVIGYWVSENFSDPSLVGQLKLDWELFVSKQTELGEDIEFVSLEKFLQDYPERNWVTFCLSQIGAAGGSTGTTVWIVLDMNVHGQ